MSKPASLRRMSETQQRRGLQPDRLDAGVTAAASEQSAPTPLPLTPAELAHVSPSPSSSMAQARALVSLAAAVPGLGLLPRAVVRSGAGPGGRGKTQGGAARNSDPLPPRKTPNSALTNTVSIPALRTIPGLNTREHWRDRARRVKAEHCAVSWSLVHAFGRSKPPLPLVVRMTRHTPSHVALDDDNLAGALKAVRDSIAKWLGVDDGKIDQVRYVNAQQTKRPWAVVIEFLPMPTLTDEVTPC